MPTFVGIDYGTRRIGLARAHSDVPIATPAETLPGTGRPADDARAVLTWAAADPPATYVVGLPLNMDGTDSAQTRLTRQFAAALAAAAAPAAVELWDERLSSYAADERMRSAAVRPTRQRSARDALAAQVILQAYLDAHPR